MNLQILHICSDYAKQSIYDQLITHLSKVVSKQYVYVPVRSASEINKYKNDALNNVEYCYSQVLNKLDRLNYKGKIKKTSKDLQNHVDLKNVKLIHAHFLFSDGGNAYEIHKKTGIPYIVAVRNTDLNFFLKYFIHLRSFALEILLNAEKIIFLSHAYKKAMFAKYIPKKFQEIFLEKTMVIANGVNPYWLENRYQKNVDENRESWIALYVGDFSKNKNIQISIRAIEKLRKENKNICFYIVGGGGDYDYKIRKLAEINSDWITLIGRINDNEKLLKIYRACDFFVMPSKFETFGLVYIEAMSQGLPTIYTKGQGIDGYFKNGEIGYATENRNYKDLASNIDQMMDNYKFMSNNAYKLSNNFSWEIISNSYYNLYIDILNNDER